jgi:hypothetical protein
MSVLEMSGFSDTLENEDPRTALTAEGMTSSRREPIMYFSTQKPVDYHSYLKSVDWKRKKVEWVNSGRPLKCWACEKPMPKNRSNFNFHHRTYANLGNENLDDLVLLCQYDHERLSNEWKAMRVATKGHCLHNHTHIYIFFRRLELGLSTEKSNLIMQHLGAYHE